MQGIFYEKIKPNKIVNKNSFSFLFLKDHVFSLRETFNRTVETII